MPDDNDYSAEIPNLTRLKADVDMFPPLPRDDGAELINAVSDAIDEAVTRVLSSRQLDTTVEVSITMTDVILEERLEIVLDKHEKEQ
jgi:hypothetical protein